MKKNIIHTAIFRLVVPIPYGALVYLLLLMINNNLKLIDESFLSAELFFCIILTYLSLEINRLSIIYIFKKFKLTIGELVAKLAVNVLITLILVYFALMIYFVVLLGYTSLTGFETEVKSFAMLFGITSILYSMLSISYFLLSERNEQLISDEETLKQQVQFELDAYQAEVNPNLLFESLESAISLIQHDVDKAEDYIDHLALVYRYMLTNKEKGSCLLTDEVEAAKNLLVLHNVRYNGQISVHTEIANNEIRLLPGSLPMLIEEIINRNIISEHRPLSIVLNKEDNYLTVSHKLNERLTKNGSEQMTFKRLQMAYAFYTDQPLIKVQAYGEAFYKIPIINKSPVAA